MNGRSRNWWDLSTAEFAALDMSRIVAIQPVAAVEQHGPHLPVRVDAAINEGVLDRAIRRLRPETQALVLPAMPVGKSNEHVQFPGTLTLSYETLGRAWFEIAESVARTGCRKLIFFNSHGGQPQLIDIVCRELRVRLGMFAVACSWFSTIDVSDLIDEHERIHGIHAGRIETSMMLHLHPDLVDMAKAQDFESAASAIAQNHSVLRVEGTVGFGWQSQDLNRFGACGDASGADAELGSKLVDRAADALANLIVEVERYPLDNLTAKTAFGPPRPPNAALGETTTSSVC
jgi:creatinine amidohydrolase